MAETSAYPQVDFIGIGFPRSGTTWLSECLMEHPEVCFSREKETHFFDLDYHYEQGPEFYAACFACEPGARVTGEFTPEYIREPEKCAARIRERYPDAKLIVVLRDPVLRSFSHYRYRKYKAGQYESFDELLEGPDTDPIVRESTYIRMLEPFLARFPREQFLFLVHEESFADPAAYFRRVCRFLGVDEAFVPPKLGKKVNITDNQGTRFTRLEHGLNRLRWILRGSAPGRVLLAFARAVGITALVTRFRGFNRVPVRDPERLSREEYETFWRHFEPSVRELEAAIGLDLRAWWGSYRDS